MAFLSYVTCPPASSGSGDGQKATRALVVSASLAEKGSRNIEAAQRAIVAALAKRFGAELRSKLQGVSVSVGMCSQRKGPRRAEGHCIARRATPY
jgi:hypothetical protein